MPRGVYPRKPRRRRRVNKSAAAQRQAAKFGRAISGEMNTAARALVNVAGLRLTRGSDYTAANIIAALTQGLGFSKA